MTCRRRHGRREAPDTHWVAFGLVPDQQPSVLGPNAWLVDEMYDQYRADPSSVSESWREFFADYRKDDAATGGNGQAAPVSKAAPAPPEPVPAPVAPPPAAAPAATPVAP